MKYTMLLAEVASLLAAHGGLHCNPSVECDGDDVIIAVRIPVDPEFAAPDKHARALAQTANLRHAMEYLRDTATIRAVAIRYDIPIESFEALMPKQED